MRPKITTSRSIARSLTYNELKVTQGRAECLQAANFLKDLPRLTPADKLHCFKRRMELNENVRTSLHITLNFDPSDQLSNEKMKNIAGCYMKEIGFERQPYLVYRHHDAGHPHCHIVTTHVRPNGDPIELFNIGRNQSEKAKQRIESEFQLVTAEKKQEPLQQLQQALRQQQQAGQIKKVKYGESSTTRSVSRVLEHVTENYRYTSLKQLNAVLKLYNVEAYRGREDSKLYQRRGLLYRVLDEHGKYIGVPLKASFFDCKPTLDNLEKKMVQNQALKQQAREHMTFRVQWNLVKNSATMQLLTQKMTQDKIYMVLHRDKQGLCNDVTYIDFAGRSVFSGSELGERCDHNTIQRLINWQNTPQEKARQQSEQQSQKQTYRLRQS